MAVTDSCHSFADFPEDVQFCVLSFLTPAEIACFSCTSKQFVSLCASDSKLWYSLCARRWGSKTQINKWGGGKISYKLLYRTLSEWDNLIGYWRRCGQSQQRLPVTPPSLVLFEWGPSFLSGWRVSPSQNGTYSVTKAPFLRMGISPEGEIVNYLDPDGQNGELPGQFGLPETDDLFTVSVNFIGSKHFSVEENVGLAHNYNKNMKGYESEDSGNGFESGSPGSLPETSEMYRYYANRMSPGGDRAWRRQRRRGKERQGKKRWETEHFKKIVDFSPTEARPLQGLWKGICNDMKLEFYLVEYDGNGISCRRVGDMSERSPVFWTSNPVFIESPLSAEEEHIYGSRTHLRPPAAVDHLSWQCSLIDNEVVSRIMCINASYELLIPTLPTSVANPWRDEGRIWQYRNGTFGFGFLRDNFIVDMKHVVQNGCLLDMLELHGD